MIVRGAAGDAERFLSVLTMLSDPVAMKKLISELQVSTAEYKEAITAYDITKAQALGIQTVEDAEKIADQKRSEADFYASKSRNDADSYASTIKNQCEVASAAVAGDRAQLDRDIASFNQRVAEETDNLKRSETDLLERESILGEHTANIVDREIIVKKKEDAFAAMQAKLVDA